MWGWPAGECPRLDHLSPRLDPSVPKAGPRTHNRFESPAACPPVKNLVRDFLLK